MSPTWQAPAAGRHTLPAGCLASAGLLGLGRSQHSAWLSARAADVHSVAVWPAGCWHVSLVPLQVSAVHGLPSSVHAVPLACLASAGQLALEPVQVSARSHSPTTARHTVLAGWKASRAEERSVGTQLGAPWQTPAAAQHTVPARPAGCWHVSLVPLQVSAVHGLPSSVHAVPLACLASAGQLALEPVQVSARSHSPTAARHTVLAGWKAS